jgi:hypothetical protein
MSYRQYTKCVDIGSFVGFTWVQYVFLGGAAVAAAALALLLGGAFVPALMIGVLSAIIAYCLWWLYDRLICLGGDVCAVGFVLTAEPPSDKSGLDSFDTDFSINLVLAPTLVGATRSEVEGSAPLGVLVQETTDISNYSFAGYQLPFSGNLVTALSTGDPHGGQFTTDCLHVEFEGGGVYDLLQSCYAALALAIAAAAVCAIPVFGWIACLVLSVLSGLITLAGIINALNDTANPTDVNGNIIPVHAAELPDGSGADILLVKGTWVYDSAHSGWNEIHPIKQCQKIGAMIDQGWSTIQVGTPNDPQFHNIPDINAYVANWCALTATVILPGTVASQQLPQNQWIFHPLIDGCQSPGQGPPPTQ